MHGGKSNIIWLAILRFSSYPHMHGGKSGLAGNLYDWNQRYPHMHGGKSEWHTFCEWIEGVIPICMGVNLTKH